MNKPVIEINMESGGKIRIELEPEYAPNAVNSILELADLGGYKNLVIQRIAPDFVLQPWYDETRMDERFHYVMDCEIWEEGPGFEKYTVGMAGDGESISSCGCFFIVTGKESGKRLNGKFTLVGRVTEGFEEVERIMRVETRDVDSGMEGVVVKEPLRPEVICDITYQYNGYCPGKVVKRLEHFE